jgi:hypothetical protein
MEIGAHNNSLSQQIDAAIGEYLSKIGVERDKSYKFRKNLIWAGHLPVV